VSPEPTEPAAKATATDEATQVATVETAAFRIPTDAPEADGTFAWDATTLVLVTVRTADPRGPVGTGWTYAPAAAAAFIQELLTPVVVGRSVWDVTTAWTAMRAALRNAGRPGLGAMAISALDVALWDLQGRLRGLPLHRLWGAARASVPVYGSGGFTTYDDDRTARQLEGWLADGFGSVKIKIAESWGTRVERDLHRVALARRVAGERTGLFVDANGGYQVGQAIRVGRRLADHGVTWFEEPVSSDDTDGLGRVRRALDCDVAAGEYCYEPRDAARLLDAGAVDCLQLDATRCGGYTGWFRAAALAETRGLQVSGHCAPYLHAPVAAATPALRHVEWFHDHVRIEQRLLEPAYGAPGGLLAPSERPGHGWDVRPGRLAEHRVA